MSFIYKNEEEALHTDISHAKNNGLSIIMPGIYADEVPVINNESHYEPGFIYKASCGNDLLVLGYDEYEKQLVFLKDLIPLATGTNVLCTTAPGYFSKHVLQHWAESQNSNLTYGVYSLHDTHEWKEQFYSIKPAVWIATVPELILLLTVDDIMPDFLQIIIVINPGNSIDWQKDFVARANGKRMLLFLESDILPGFSFYKDIIAKNDAVVSRSYQCIRPESWVVTKNGKKASMLVKGDLTVQVKAAGNNKQLVILAGIAGSMRSGGYEINFPPGSIMLSTGVMLSGNDIRNLVLAKSNNIIDTQVVFSDRSLFPAIVYYESDDIVDHKVLGNELALFMGLRRSINRVSLYSPDDTSPDDTTLSVLSAYHDNENQRIKLSLKTDFLYQPLAFKQLKIYNADTKSIQDEDEPLAIVEAPYPSMPANFQFTLTAHLHKIAKTTKAVTFVKADGTEDVLGYNDLLQRAMKVAGGLQELGIAAQSPVLIQLNDQAAWITLYWAILLNNSVAAPLAVPKLYTEENDTVQKLKNIIELLDRPIVVCEKANYDWYISQLAAWGHGNINVIAWEDIKHVENTTLPVVEPDDMALYMFTSGSTGLPKCIMQTHRALVFRSYAVGLHCGFSGDDIFLNWMPLDHIGGIQMSHNNAIVNGASQVSIPIEYIIANPVRWLNLIDKYRATYTWSPNFAFGLLQQEADVIRNGIWDLSCMKHWLTGGESVSAFVTKEVIELLMVHGLNEHAVYPAYGMSETCSGITHALYFDGIRSGLNYIVQSSMSGRLEYSQTGTDETVCLVEVGPPVPGVSIRITDRNNEILTENRIGLLQVKGPTITKGYLKNEEANSQLLAGGWFNTGDLGFIKDGVLTVTGREKDLIIINGLNYQNYEIERYVEEIPEIGANGAIAASYFEPAKGKEMLYVFFTTNSTNYKELAIKLSNVLACSVGITPDVVVAVNKEDFLVTSSGKKRRPVQLETYLESDVVPVYDTSRLKSAVFDSTLFFEDTWFEIPAVDKVYKKTTWWLVADGEALNAYAHDAEIFDNIFTIASLSDHLDNHDNVALENVSICYSPFITSDKNSSSSWVQELKFLKNILGSNNPVTFIYFTKGLRGKDNAMQFGHIPGLLQSVAEEMDNVNIRWVDTDALNADIVHKQLCCELSDLSKVVSVSWQEGKRYQQALRTLNDTTEISPQTAIKQNGFYLITGGFGGVGSFLLKKLIEHYNIKALVIGRTDLENKNVLASIFDFENRASDRLEVYKTLPQTSVIYRCCNVGDRQALQAIIEEVEGTEGRQLDGYFHLAGVAKLSYHWEHVEEHLFTTEDTAVFEWMLQSKVYGTINLEEIFNNRTDFLRVVFGSINAYFGANSFSTYAAVNSFIRFYTEERNVKYNKGIYSIHWSQWKRLGMSEGNQLNTLSANRGYSSIDPNDGWKALQNILRLAPGNYISGLQPENDFIKSRVQFFNKSERLYAICDPSIGNKSLIAVEKLVKISLSSWKLIKTKDERLFHIETLKQLSFEDMLLNAEDDKPFTSLQSGLADIWKELLGIEKIKLTDNFFQLGGHSIKATRMIARVKDKFRIQLAFSALFKYPSLEELAHHIEQNKGDTSVIQILPVQPASHYPLSPSQYRLWMVHKMEGGRDAYLVPGIYNIEGELDKTALRNAITALVQKHEILRTVFVEKDNEPYQKILTDVAQNKYFTYRDIENGIDEEIKTLIAKGFDLNGGLLFHCYVFKVDEHLHRMLVLLHHINADGVTLAVLRNDLSAFYTTCVQKEQLQYEVPAVQYKDFSAWYNTFLASDNAEHLKKYWIGKLSGTIPVLDMPADYPRKPKQSFKGSSVEVKLDHKLTAALEAIANTHKLSLFAVLTSLVKTIVWRHSAQDDVIIGTSVDLRINSQLEGQAGQYVNVLPLRDKLDASLTFEKLLQNVNTTLADALENKLYPFEKLVNELELPRDTTRNPLFSVLLVMHNFEASTSELTGTQWKPVHSDNDTSKFDYVFAFRKDEDGLLVNLRYCNELFYKKRAEGLLEDLNALAHGVAVDTRKTLKSYQLHIDEQILVKSKEPFVEPYFNDVIDSFIKQVELYPSNAAISFDGTNVSYKALYDRATSFAALCASVDGQRIIVAKAPSVDWLATLLGVWMSGKTYIPMDASFPPQVIISQLKGVEPAAVIADVATIDVISACLEKAELTNAVVHTDAVFANFDTTTSFNWTDEAYIVFTSGSTGIPKGIIGNRRSLSHFINWEADLLGLHEKQGVNISQLTQPTFDASFRDIFLALTTGNTVVIPLKEIRKDIVTLNKWLVENEVNIIHAVPSLLRALLTNADNGKENSLQYVLCAGEQLYKHDVDAIQDKLGSTVKVMNLYGATETTLIKTYWDTSGIWYHDALPVGKGIYDCDVLILNESNLLCAPGEAGEVFIRTPYMSNGYLNNELNNGNFIQNPLHNEYPDIIYRTGDAGRYAIDGNLQLIGRKDEQVKINGVRIELKEIERAALNVEGVSAAIATVIKEQENTTLALYYTSDGIDENYVGVVLKGVLPIYAIPSHIMRINAIPVNANGKVDKAVLPSPVALLKTVQVQDVILHDALTTAWTQTLKIPAAEMDTTKDFFHSGGNSLLAMILLAKLQQVFGVRIPIEEFFRNPHLSFLQTFAPLVLNEEVVAIKKIEKAESYSLSHAQQRMWILNEMEMNNITYNVKRSYVLSGKVDIEALRHSFCSLIQCHEILRTSFLYKEGEVVQVVHDNVNIEECFIYNDVSSSVDAVSIAQEHVEAFFAEPFRLDSCPLIKLLLQKTASDKWVFAIIKHHIISDGWSMEVVARELIEGYNLFLQGKQVGFAELPFQYKDYAAWQNEYLSAKELKQDENYWLSKLKNLPEPLELPYDRPRFSVKTFNGDLYKFNIDTTLSQKLRSFSEEQKATVFMVMLAAVKTLFYRYTAQTDIVIGTPTAGRRIPGVESQVGFYVNTLALRTSFDSTDDFATLLQKVKKTTLEGLDHQDYPFDTLVDKLQLEKRMDHSPLFDVVVQFMNTTVTKEKQISFDGLTVDPFDAKWHNSQFDQNFFFTETASGIQGVVEFNTDIFDKTSIARQVQHLNNILSAIVEDAGLSINAIQFLTDDEKIAHHALRSTDTAYPQHNLYAQFEIAALQYPGATAIITTKGNKTYALLKEVTNRLTSLLLSVSKGGNSNIALLMDEGVDAVTSMLASLQSGCCYVPVAVTFPYERMKYLVEDSGSSMLLFSKKYLKEAGKLYWECEKLQYGICIDSNDIAHELEPVANIMSEELWDFVGQSATDDITGGAWFSSYTGLPISRIEMDEYAQNAYKKLQPYLSKDSRVLEVGCASAITMSAIAPMVKHYTGADLSANILEIAKKNLATANIANHDLIHAAAHDVCKNISGTYDVLIFNSVAQCFSGYNYFRNVIESLLPFLSDKAVIFFGDIQDLNKKAALEESLHLHAVKYPQHRIKLDWSQELFVPQDFFNDLPNYFPEVVSVNHSAKIASVENELTLFRYDTIVTIDKTIKQEENTVKTWYDLSDIALAVPYTGAEVDIDTPAYIIYTSGSTGNPKGCVITHRNLIRLFFNDKMPFGFSERDVWIQSHGYHFDFSVWEIFGALLYGGSLIIPTREEIRDISVYYSLLKQHKVTVLNNTPRAFYNFSQYLLQNNDPHDVSTHLRYIVFGGEKLQPDRLQAWMKRFPSIAMINMYGITETTVHVTYHQITLQQVTDEPHLSVIGLPIPETVVYIKDAFGNDVPFNVIAEMNIGGTGVAAGYHQRKELTAQKFSDNLYGDGRAIYHSGDYGKIRPDGNLVYINRRDAQVKIRGYRIETGEIEAVLLKYAEVKQAAVIVKTDKSGDNSLIAYYTGQQVETDMLRKYIAMQLPSYMVPSTLMYLSELPMTINGKLDVKKLPEPGIITIANALVGYEDLTPTEQVVMVAFCEVLNRDQVALTDNFFDLGGHSLKAMNLMSLLHSRIRVGVPLVYLYKFPTVKEIAHYIDCARYMNIQYKEHPYIQLGNPEGKRTVILFPPALGSALAYSHLASLLDDTRLFSFNYVDNNDTMQNYVRLLNEIQPEGDLYIAGHSAGGFMAFHVAKAMEHAGRKVGGIIILDAFRQGKEGKYHTHDTIMEGVDQYLAYKFEEYKDHFIDMDFFKEVCYNQVKQYYDFLFHAEQKGDIFIQAPIHFMIAENNYERQENWTPCTAGGVKVYYASGIHGKMVDEPWVRPNADIINDIIQQQIVRV